MNPSIILAGQQPDFVNTLARATQAGEMTNQAQQNNALRNLYASQGDQIIQGEQGAVNALARIDPQQAMGVQQTRLGMDQTRQQMQFSREKMQMLREQAKMQAMESVARLSAEERTAAKERLEGVLNGAAQFYQSGDRAGFQNWVQQNGLDPAQYSFDQFPAHLASATGTIEALTEAQEYAQGPEDPASIQALRIRAKEAGLQEGTPEYQQFMLNAGKQQEGQRISINPETGAFEFATGAGLNSGSGGKTPTERQSTLALFGGLMGETMPTLNAMELDPEFDPTSIRSSIAGEGTAGNVATTPKARQYEALKRQWAEGVLRIQTGAAATEPEIQRVMDTYFPRFGDDDATVEQKRIQRDVFARSLVPASGGTIQAPGGAGERAGLGGEGAPEGAGEVIFENDEQRSVYEKYSQP